MVADRTYSRFCGIEDAQSGSFCPSVTEECDCNDTEASLLARFIRVFENLDKFIISRSSYLYKDMSEIIDLDDIDVIPAGKYRVI